MALEILRESLQEVNGAVGASAEPSTNSDSLSIDKVNGKEYYWEEEIDHEMVKESLKDETCIVEPSSSAKSAKTEEETLSELNAAG